MCCYLPAGSGSRAWLSRVGDGSEWVVGRGEQQVVAAPLAQDSPLWYPGDGSQVRQGRCLYLGVSESGLRQHPEAPYSSWFCSRTDTYPLCEGRCNVAATAEAGSAYHTTTHNHYIHKSI